MNPKRIKDILSKHPSIIWLVYPDQRTFETVIKLRFKDLKKSLRISFDFATDDMPGAVAEVQKFYDDFVETINPEELIKEDLLNF